MDSDLMHFSSFYFYLDEGNFSQYRMCHVAFISAFGDRSFSISFTDDGLSPLEFFIV
jgi:hypothetical protein